MSKKLYDEEIAKAIDDLDPNIVVRGVSNLGTGGIALYLAFILTGSMGWLKWPIRVVSFFFGVFISEVVVFIHNHFDKKRMAEMLSDYSRIAREQGADSAEKFLQANCSNVIEELNHKIANMKNEVSGNEAALAQLAKQLKQAEKAEAILNTLELDSKRAAKERDKAQAELDKTRKEAEKVLNKLSKDSTDADGIMEKFSEALKSMSKPTTKKKSGTDNS